jgi:hypothetical protein
MGRVQRVQRIDGIDDYIVRLTSSLLPDRRSCASEEQLGGADRLDQSMRRPDEYVVTFEDGITFEV